MSFGRYQVHIIGREVGRYNQAFLQFLASSSSSSSTGISIVNHHSPDTSDHTSTPIYLHLHPHLHPHPHPHISGKRETPSLSLDACFFVFLFSTLHTSHFTCCMTLSVTLTIASTYQTITYHISESFPPRVKLRYWYHTLVQVPIGISIIN